MPNCVKELDSRQGSIRIDTRFRTGTLIARGNGGPDRPLFSAARFDASRTTFGAQQPRPDGPRCRRCYHLCALFRERRSIACYPSGALEFRTLSTRDFVASNSVSTGCRLMQFDALSNAGRPADKNVGDTAD